MKLIWEAGAEISVRAKDRETVISANRAGLLSLANHLSTLAGEFPGSHIHYDDQNSLEEGSAELVVEMKPE